MTYPLKFRQKVFRVKEKYNLTYEQTSERINLSIRTLFRWQIRLEPYLTRNKPATKLDMDALKEAVERYPDDYQWERAKRFNVCQSTIGWALKRLGLAIKKTLKHPRDNPQLRADFQEKIARYESKGRPLVYYPSYPIERLS